MHIPIYTKAIINIREKCIVKLEKERNEILARHHIELQKINNKIDNMIAIDYKENTNA